MLVAQSVLEFQSLLSGLGRELLARVERFVPAVARLDQYDLLAFVTDAYPELATPFLAASADLTATWYDGLLPGSDFVAKPAELMPVDRLAASARWSMLQPDPTIALGGVSTRAVFETSRQTVASNTVEEGVRWARFPAATACGFCRLLATRGPAYSTEANALAGHNNCHCVAVPMRDGKFHPSPYVAQWKRDYRAARDGGARTAGEIANAMDYQSGGRRDKGYGTYVPRTTETLQPVNLDVPATPTKVIRSESATAARLLPGFEKSLADLRAQGLPEDSPQIQYHLAQIAKLRRQLALV